MSFCLQTFHLNLSKGFLLKLVLLLFSCTRPLKLVFLHEKLLNPKKFLYGVSWYRVEEQQNHESDENKNGSLDNTPLVVVPNDVANGLEGIQEPHK